MATKNKTGRPSEYLPEVAEDICALLADGESLRSICKRPGMPNKATVFRWLRIHKEFCDQYAKATDSRADAVFEEMLYIADDAAEESAAVAKARLQIDTRKWVLSRMNPKKYGDKVTQEIDHKSSDGSMTPKPTTIQLLPVEPKHE
ncbi:ubiquitin carboxyl-hydrolase [Salmonella enterica]|uniref:terminase small subunit-like protein n=1 Tax=Salmonella enterica TaxID=28901 RepID=UPI000A38FB4B|nr:ubiquitin carboxyl-hydrolase [Salmonella enterica]EBJ4216936.1 ubiquitin carboxyl-hydrolase [Salmonella enterica]EBN9758007.1 ubiquitin carboxyl-hydrolase [Salmonella enterica]ECH2091507.1 ubiquitin carboxyl-hydrolase [Salmonella enterica]ECS6291749.1 ubiquitin carboxyl-hydrolase [Salmonella enterica subsp. enterica serovar Birkenhead]ECV3125757.1 ubiquitin carboxyl-hydrolase [Salmonella enterica]